MEQRIITDFDLDISQVILAHHHITTRVDAYRNGRKLHGIVCPISGLAQYSFPGYPPIRLGPGEIALIPATTSYRVGCIGTEPFDHYTVNFLGQIETFPKWIPRDRMYVLQTADFAVYQKQIQEMVTLWQQHRTGYRMQVRARLLALLANYLTESISQVLNPGSYGRTLPAKQMIDERYAEKLTLEEMAKACNMSLSGFRRAFMESYQQSPGAYLTNLRLEKAKEFLLLGYTLEEVAQLTGFGDVNYFIRYFHRKTGVTPGRFRYQ